MKIGMRFKHRLKLFLLASSLLLTALNACSHKKPQASEQISSASYNVMVGEEARKLVFHCTNIYSSGVSGYWEPSREKIEELERLLIPFLSAQNIKDVNLASYVRQYAGVIKGDRSMIFVNGVNPSIMEVLTKGRDISKDAVVLCDGGKMIYGVEYDVETKRFDVFSLNPER